MSTRGRGRGRGGGGGQSNDRASSSSADSSRSSSLTRPPSATSIQDPDRLMKQLMTQRGPGSTILGGLGPGARPSRQFAPNINVLKKDKDKTDSTNSNSASNLNNELSTPNKDDIINGHRSQRGRGRGGNNKGGRGDGNYKQEDSIFAHGVPVPVTSNAGGSSSASSRPSSSIKRESTGSGTKGPNIKKLGIEKKTLYGDVDGLKYEIDEENEPRLIPLAQRKSVFDVKKETSTIPKAKEPISSASEHIDSFVKLFSEQKLDSSVKPIVKDEPVELTDLPKLQEPLNDLSKLILMQFPDVLPCTRTSSSSTKPELAALSDLPDGFLGKLQIFKSGKCRLKLNDDTYLDVDIGQSTSFLQNVMVTEMASPTVTDDNGTTSDMNKLVCLGDIKHKLIVSLDAEHVLQDS